MSTPAGAAHPARATAQGPAGQATATAAQTATTQAAQNAPAQANQNAPAARAQQPQPDPGTQRSSTPRLLRVARTAATAAALLTGVVATGTFDTSGLNSTPNVIANHWVAAEEARVEIAEADLVAARAVAEAVAGESTDADIETPLTAAADAHARSGGDAGRAGQVAGDLVRVGLLTGEALATAPDDAEAATTTYASASALARTAADTAQQVAAQHATDLQTGSRSMLTALVGLFSTALLGGILVWLALRTRRIINVPLLVAAAITGWLSYVSVNPSALPLDIDRRVDQVATAATALQEVREARQAEYATVLGLDDADLETAGMVAGDAVFQSGSRDAEAAWTQVVDGHEAVLAADGPAAALEAVRATETSFAQAEAALQELLDNRLAPATSSIGTPAAITSGVALLLGLVAAVAAWTGLTQRLKDYR